MSFCCCKKSEEIGEWDNDLLVEVLCVSDSNCVTYSDNGGNIIAVGLSPSLSPGGVSEGGNADNELLHVE